MTYLVKVVGKTRFTSTRGGRVTYHDSCHLLRGLHESQSARTLLRNLEGVEFVELPGSDECCGFGGSFAVRLPEVSTSILERKLRNVESTGASCLVACDAGCLMQMGGGLRRSGSAVRAVHLAELLEVDVRAAGRSAAEASGEMIVDVRAAGRSAAEASREMIENVRSRSAPGARGEPEEIAP